MTKKIRAAARVKTEAHKPMSTTAWLEDFCTPDGDDAIGELRVSLEQKLEDLFDAGAALALAKATIGKDFVDWYVEQIKGLQFLADREPGFLSEFLEEDRFPCQDLTVKIDLRDVFDVCLEHHNEKNCLAWADWLEAEARRIRQAVRSAQVEEKLKEEPAR